MIANLVLGTLGAFILFMVVGLVIRACWPKSVSNGDEYGGEYRS